MKPGSIARPFSRVAWLILACLVLVASNGASAQSLASKSELHNPTWRDSVAAYQGRLTAYSMELYSYDLARTFASLPVVGESYVGRTGTGIAFASGRLASIAITSIGAVRLIGGYQNLPLNIGMTAFGLLSWGVLKLLEIQDVLHHVSHLNEELALKWNIALPDVVSGSIRYPEGNWPSRVTNSPATRLPQDAREAIDWAPPRGIVSNGASLNLQLQF